VENPVVMEPVYTAAEEPADTVSDTAAVAVLDIAEKPESDTAVVAGLDIAEEPESDTAAVKGSYTAAVERAESMPESA